MLRQHGALSRPKWLPSRALMLAALVLAGCTSAPVAPPAAPPGQPELSARLARSPFKEPPGVYSSAVHQANIDSTICVSGWTATVRPSTSYTQALKKRMLESQGIAWAEATKYELDHYVPLALGGDPRSVDNLWLESWTGEWNARIKDRLERKLQVMVCARQLTLKVARDAIRDDWKAAFHKYVETAAAARSLEPDDDDEPVE